MDTKLAVVICLSVALVARGTAHAADETIPAKVGIVKPDKLAKFVSKGSGFPLPTGAAEDPTVHGAQISFFDTAAGGGGSFVHALPAAGWVGLGSPAGSKGFKYKGSAAGDSTCSIILIKPTVIKGVCKGVGVTLTTPFAGDDGIIIGIPAGGSPVLRYCADLGGTPKKNNSSGLKRTDAPAPATCPVQPAPATATATATGTPAGTAAATATATATGTPAGTAAATATATNTSASAGSATPTPTNTPGVVCPLAAGRYRTTTTGGSLRVSTFQPFTFPAGGKTIQDMSAPDVNCVSTTVVPAPGTCTSGACTAGDTGASCSTNEDCNGLTVPLFCVPALSYTVHVTQTACGIGKMDSNGGSDFTITEHGDTSYALNGCNVAQSCVPSVDSSGDIDITVGDGVVDTCASGGTGNSIVSIPVNTVTWQASEAGCFGGTNDGTFCTMDAQCTGGGTCSGTACPDPNGLDGSDTIITQFPQTLDLTTDKSTAQFADNDGNGCSLAGSGPQGPFSSTGKCMDFGAMTVNVAGGGTVFSSAAPLYDLLFTTVQNSTFSGPAASGGATCGTPPVINFAGLAHRCIIAP